MKSPGNSTTFLVKGLLCCCTFLALTFLVGSSQAFAATKSYEHLEGEKTAFNTALITPHAINCLASDSLTCDVTPAISYGGSGCPTSGWSYAFLPDYGLFPYALSTGSYSCARATWDDHSLSQTRDCKFFAYIPSIYATAQISYGIYNSSGTRIGVVPINQNNYASTDAQIDTYAYLGEWSNVHHISFSSNTGVMDDYISAAVIRYACFN